MIQSQQHYLAFHKLKVDQVVCLCTEKSGGTIYQVKALLRDSKRKDSQILILQLGENDIKKDTNPKEIARKLISLAYSYLDDHPHCKKVYIGQLLKRHFAKHNKYINTLQQSLEFNINIAATNHHIQKSLKRLQDNRITYFHHKDMNDHRHQHEEIVNLPKDPIHLNKTGEKRLARSWRGMLLNFLKEEKEGRNIRIEFSS
ncbi:unnamed protein product [Owenia fusiformis]|uniref:Uncharacterized protein n=1 Tax=Owenia fusiformis TaxID=6347 RepID=A0A8J1UI27_OWEFU|nr:unnamed protein product [Owenia fusiformis]